MAEMGAGRLGEQIWGPGGDKGHIAAHSLPWGQTCWNNWLDSSKDGGQSWAAAEALGPQPRAPQPQDHPALYIPFKGGRDRTDLGLPQSLHIGGCRQVKAGVSPNPILFLFLHQPR